MKLSDRLIAGAAFVGLLCMTGTAAAFDPGGNRFTSGEVSVVQSCFYECKQKQLPFDALTDDTA